MGLPNINIAFREAADTAERRLASGNVGIIIRDVACNGACVLKNERQIAEKLAGLGTINADYIRRAFMGNTNLPNKVTVYVLPPSAANLEEALAFMETEQIGYLVGPHDGDYPGEAQEIMDWVAARRELGETPKAVLPAMAADKHYIVNFTTTDIAVGSKIYTAAAYCSRIAGLIAGTPPRSSCTYAPLKEVSKIGILSRPDQDAAVDNGELILFSDGGKIKVARGVNSLTTTTEEIGASFKKIKIVEILDMINDDIRTVLRETYIGRYPNSYDSKCLIVSAIGEYFTELEKDTLLMREKSTVKIDVDAQEKWLREHGIDTSKMTEREIREANTGSEVFLTASIKPYDAIEDITLNIAV